MSTNRYLLENIEWPDFVGMDDMSPSYTLNQYFNMKYNNVHHKLKINGHILTPKNSSLSTLASLDVT